MCTGKRLRTCVNRTAICHPPYNPYASLPYPSPHLVASLSASSKRIREFLRSLPRTLYPQPDRGVSPNQPRRPIRAKPDAMARVKNCCAAYLPSGPIPDGYRLREVVIGINSDSIKISHDARAQVACIPGVKPGSVRVVVRILKAFYGSGG